MTTPKVSVLTTSYNPGKYLKLAVDSLNQQTFTDFEHILLDNGSADDSIELLGDLDPRCKLSRYKDNLGRTPALQKAFMEATGEYVAILDADDVWHPMHLQRLVASLDQNPNIVLAGTWCRWIDANGVEVNRTLRPTEPVEIRNRMAWENPFSNSATMFRRQVALDAGGYDNEYAFAQDFDLFVKLVQRGDAMMLPEYLTDIRELANSATQTLSVPKAHDEVRLYIRAGKELDINAQSRDLNRVTTAQMAWTYAAALRSKHNIFRGWGWNLWAVWRDPLVILRRIAIRMRRAAKPQQQQPNMPHSSSAVA